MSRLDVAGVIGTWVGAGIGIVALIGLVGPLLVWRATRTERFKAIAAVGEDSHGFISHGIPIWPNIRIFRRVRAPMLKREPDFSSKKFGWNLGELPEKGSASSWVELGALLKVYDKNLPIGHEIEVYGGKTYLRVHRAWVLAIGLMGRFSRREDRGQMKSRRSVMLQIRTPARVLSRDEDFRWSPDEDLRSRRPHSDELHGITGVMTTTETDIGQGTEVPLEFRLASKSALSFEPEVLSLTQLFMLSIGCIPMADNSYFSLRDLGAFENDPSDSASSDSDLLRERRRHKSGHIPRARIDSRENENPKTHTGVQTFKLERVVERDEALIGIGSAFAAEKTTVFSLQSFRASRAESTVLENCKDMTYIPASSEWVRLPDLNNSSDHIQLSEVYLARADAQRMALALLQLPWHPEGYLLGAEKSDNCLQLLLMCSTQLPALMSYAQNGIDQLDLTAPEKKTLHDAIQSLHRRFDKSSLISRATLHEMLKLEKIVINLSHKNEQVNEMIGIMMITNSEFMNLVRQSARRFDQAPPATINADMRSGVLKIPSAFGILQEFPLSITELYPRGTFTDDLIPIRYSAVLISSLRACLRSAMLRDCFSSNPLIEKVLGFQSTIHVS